LERFTANDCRRFPVMAPKRPPPSSATCKGGTGASYYARVVSYYAWIVRASWWECWPRVKPVLRGWWVCSERVPTSFARWYSSGKSQQRARGQKGCSHGENGSSLRVRQNCSRRGLTLIASCPY
jgi:hypothetical protein